MEKILIVEDDTGIADFLKTELRHEGFDILYAPDGRTALSSFESGSPDIVLLDIMLPEISGLEVLRRIRKNSAVPVILLTARGDTYDKVNGLNAGADDYLAKPFEVEELLARIRAVLRRSSGTVSLLKIRNLVLNSERMEVKLNDEPVELSRTEFFLLRTLMENENIVLTRDQLISSVWGKGHYIDENSVDVYVRYIRHKIDEKAGEEYISTVRGFGYTIKNEKV
jgi:two-component system, OmpR family, response regulator ArlR